MKKSSIETAVGIFVLIGIACIGYLAIKLGNLEFLGDKYYTLYARFHSVSGLKSGASVELAGVQVGEVEALSLDTEKLVAILKLKIRRDIILSDDVIASIKTSGLIGDKFVKLSPGGADEILNPGDMITDTESPIDIEDLVSKYVFGDVK